MDSGQCAADGERGLLPAVHRPPKHRLAPILALLTLATQLCIDIHRPWNDHAPGMLGSFYHIAARNYLRNGYLDTWLAPVLTTGDLDAPLNKWVYTHHPPGMPLLVSVSFLAFGEGAPQARLVPIAFTFGSFWLLWTLARRLWDVRTARFAVWIFALIPMATFYGSLVDPQCTGPLFFSLLTLLFYLRSRERAPVLNTLGMAAAFSAGMFMDWAPALLIPSLLLHAVLCRRGGQRRMVLCYLLFAVYSVVCFAAVLTYCERVDDWTGYPAVYGGSMLEAATSRLGNEPTTPENPGSFGAIEFFVRQAGFAAAGYTLPGLLLSLGWVALFVRTRMRRDKPCERDTLVACLSLFGLLYIFLFTQGAYIHPFWGFYLIPFVIFSTSRALVRLAEIAGRRAPAFTVAVPILLLATVGAHGLWISLSLRAKTRQYVAHDTIAEQLRTRTSERSVIYCTSRLDWQTRCYTDRILRDQFTGVVVESYDRLLYLAARDRAQGYEPHYLLLDLDRTKPGGDLEPLARELEAKNAPGEEFHGFLLVDIQALPPR